MRHRNRAGCTAAASLALLSTTASAAPPVTPRAEAIPPAMFTGDRFEHTDRTVGRSARARVGTDGSWRYAQRGVETPGEAKPLPRNPTVSRRSLNELVEAYAQAEVPNAERECLAGAVYFEARSEPIEGQLAVAEVVLNRAASGRYPTSICEVVKQPGQFSFVQSGLFPPIDRGSPAWRKAVAVAHIATENLADELPSDVLWYHADHVAPGWGRRLARVTQIGAHIFYSSG